MGQCWCASVSSICQNGDKNSADCLVCDTVMSMKSMARKLSRHYIVHFALLASSPGSLWGVVFHIPVVPKLPKVGKGVIKGEVICYYPYIRQYEAVFDSWA